MKDSTIQVICGPGKGKTASALGRGISALIHGKNVIMVQFLKGSMDSDNMEVLNVWNRNLNCSVLKNLLWFLISFLKRKKRKPGSISAMG